MFPSAEARSCDTISSASSRDVRRGHGLKLVADVALECGGRFAACRHDAGATAVLELPLASAR